MECEICGQAVENSEDLQEHKEQAHPVGVADHAIDSPERPDPVGDSPEEAQARPLQS